MSTSVDDSFCSKHGIMELAAEEKIGGSGVLNPKLYQRLQDRFSHVVVAKQGEPMFGGEYVFDGFRNKYKPLNAGEYYRVNCPFCVKRNAVDTRQRLWINHRWGVGLDPDDKDYRENEKFWWMAVCYNEDCLALPENRKELRTMLYGAIGRERRGQQVIVQSAPTEHVALGIVDYPGECLRVDQLPIGHRAVQYLLSRSFDPQVLGPQYGVAYCNESYQYPLVGSKIVIPIYMSGEMVGWQARPPFDADWSEVRVPKYYNCPRTNKRLMLYGVDQADELPFCIVVEGVTDVWAIGPGAVSILGKTLAYEQKVQICNRWNTAIVVLDPDAQDRARLTCDSIEHGSNTRAVNVQLPDGTDPASIDNEYFWDLVQMRLQQEGIKVND